MKISPRLLQIKTRDRLTLPGLLFEPAARTKKVAILLHGNGGSSVFYSLSRISITAEELGQRGISYFALNNRGASAYNKLKYFVNGKKHYYPAGMAYEKIKDCILDIDAAITALKKAGYSEFYLIGHSTGANKICVYNYYKPNNPIKKYVLLNAGDDSGIYYRQFGRKKFFETLKTSRHKVKQHKGLELVPNNVLPMPYSYQSLYDIMNPDGDYNTFPYNEALNHLKLSTKPLFRHYRAIKKPTLVVHGGKDEYLYGRGPEAMQLMQDNCRVPEQFTFVYDPAADHGFTGKERQLDKIAAEWLNE